MNKNIHLFDRIIRYILGIVLLTWAIAGGPIWTYIGLGLIMTASFGACPVYWVFRINSRP
jgi:Protein of unknown function (DUF2892)